MFALRSSAKSFCSLLVLASIGFSTIFVFPQDIIASDDLAGGSSVFVFRKSRKEPQEKAAGRAMRAGGARGKGGRSHYDSQVAANRKKRVARAKANQAQLAKNRANAKITLSNTLTAKAETQLDANQIDQAIATYREALNNNPKNEDAATGLSDALVTKGTAVAGDTSNPAAIVYLDEAVKLDPKNDVAYAKLGELYDAKNDAVNARLNYEKALLIN